MIKQIMNFSRNQETDNATIEIFMLITDAVLHIEAIKVLIDDGAIIQTVDANTIRAVYKDTNQDKLLELIESGWTFTGLDVITEGSLLCVRAS
jgi:hypothetical protein